MDRQQVVDALALHRQDRWHAQIFGPLIPQEEVRSWYLLRRTSGDDLDGYARSDVLFLVLSSRLLVIAVEVERFEEVDPGPRGWEFTSEEASIPLSRIRHVLVTSTAQRFQVVPSQVTPEVIIRFDSNFPPFGEFIRLPGMDEKFDHETVAPGEHQVSRGEREDELIEFARDLAGAL